MQEEIHKLEHGVAAETDRPPGRLLIIILILLAVHLLIIAVFLEEGFKIVTAEEQYEKDLSVPSVLLMEQRAKDQKRLTTYDVVDTKRGIYQIPVADAMDRLVTHPELLEKIPPIP